MKSATVAVFNYNGLRYLKACLDSVFAQTFRDFDVLFVDDGSTDGSVAFVRSRYPQVRMIALEKNTGIANATNTGFRAATGKYIVSLHNDAVADPHWLAEFVKGMEAAGPQVAAMEGDVDHPGLGVLNGSLNFLCCNTLNAFPDPAKKFYSGTCSIILRNRLLDEYCDPDYYFYSEDVYLGWKLRLLGYDIRRNPTARVLHHGTTSASTPARRRLYQFLSERNRLLNFLTFFEKRTILKILPLYLAFGAASLLADLRSERWKVVPRLHAYVWPLFHVGSILKKRARIQSVRKVPDTTILRDITGKLLPGSSPAAIAANRFSLRYCRLLGLGVYELAVEKKQIK